MFSNFLQIVVVSLTDKPQSVRCQYATIILIVEILLEFLVLRIFNLLHNSFSNSLEYKYFLNAFFILSMTSIIQSNCALHWFLSPKVTPFSITMLLALAPVVPASRKTNQHRLQAHPSYQKECGTILCPR